MVLKIASLRKGGECSRGPSELSKRRWRMKPTSDWPLTGGNKLFICAGSLEVKNMGDTLKIFPCRIPGLCGPWVGL